MNILAWIVLGAIAGYLAGFLVRGDEGLGVIGHVVLGIVGAIVGGFLAGALLGTDPISGRLEPPPRAVRSLCPASSGPDRSRVSNIRASVAGDLTLPWARRRAEPRTRIDARRAPRHRRGSGKFVDYSGRSASASVMSSSVASGGRVPGVC